MPAIASTPGAPRLLAVSIVARLPVAMLSIGLLVHARHLTGSFAAAGIVAGAFAVALGIGGPLLVAGTVAFAAQPASRAWRPARGAARPRGGSLGTAAMRTLVVVLALAGVLFGAVEIAVTAAADALGSTAAAGPLLGIWGAG